MSVIETIESIRSGLMWVGLSALGLCLVALLGCAISGKRHSCRFPWSRQARPSPEGSGESAASPKPSRSVLVGIALLAIVCTLFGGGKMRNGGGRGATALPGVTVEEIAQGWRLESVVTNDAVSYAMPTNGVEYVPWSLGGGYMMHFPLDLGDFAFPFGTGVVRRLDVVSGGMVESLPRQRMEGRYSSAMSICAAKEYASIVPGVGRFWWAETARPESAPYQVKLLTWENVYAGRDRTGQYNAQIELCGDGNFITRSNNVERVYRRVLPFDWDDDGLENSVDPDPLVAGPDAHGTNAEWFNTVCSNVLEAAAATSAAIPPELTWREGVNTNAYYFVDVVAEDGPAPIYFTGDHESRLGNPVVVARAFETNHVPLLIGIDYAVTSPVPFSVSVPDEGFATITTNDVSNYKVRWPLNFVFTESVGASNRVYTVTVEPYDPGGVLTWEGGGIRSGMSSGCGCGCLSCGGQSVLFSCFATCTCNGACQAVGGYAFEDTLFAVTGGVCRCGFDDPPPDSPSSSHEPNDPPSLTITFGKPAVIFEDVYEEKPGVTVPRRSTRVRLTIDAYGGPAGANLWLTGVNLGKLVAVNGGASFPYSQMLAPGESYYATGMYEGVLESGVANDIQVSGSLVPNEQGENIQTNAQLTVIRILLTPEVNPPSEATSGRHTYGVCEFVRLFQFPSIPAVVWNPAGGGSNAVSRTGYSCYRFPLNACENPLRAEVDEVFYVPRLSCIEPSEIIAREVELCTYGLPAGKAGGVGLLLAFYVTPFTVSFSEIAVEEVPCDDGSVNGYFRHVMPTNAWSHTRLAGAGIWDDVDLDNRVSGRDRIRDEAGIYEELPPITPDGTITNDYSYGWMDGLMIWQIPFGWHVRGTSGETDPFGNIAGTTQEFYIDQWGHAAVRKFNNQATRRIDDRRFFNGVEVHGNIVIQQTE